MRIIEHVSWLNSIRCLRRRHHHHHHHCFPVAAAIVCLLERNSTRTSSALSLSSLSFSTSRIIMPSAVVLPKLPHSSRSFGSSSSASTFELTQLSAVVSANEERRQQAYDLSRKIQIATLRARNSVEQSLPTVEQDFVTLRLLFDQESENNGLRNENERLEKLLLEAQGVVLDHTTNTTAGSAEMKPAAAAAAASSSVTITPASAPMMDAATAARKPRQANLSYRMEDYVRLLAFRHFLQTGTLMEPPAASSSSSSSSPAVAASAMMTDNAATAATTVIAAATATDEEYLAGAVMGLALDLQRYGLGRATVRDVDSVRAAKNLVADIQDFLLQLDFRNGPLRRKYDGTKYSLKALETLLYELSITGATPSKSTAEPNAANNTDMNSPQKKRTKQESALLPHDALRAIKQRMEYRDELRETLIKKCRDGQKAAKQSIFALHRGDVQRAHDLIASCEQLTRLELMPICQQEPPLRHCGSLVGVLEEYVEAKLFAAWLQPDRDEPEDDEGNGRPRPPPPPSSSHQTPSGTLLKITDFTTLVELEPEEYLGGLCDLTGEVGRFAVQRGTARDVKGVQLCLQSNAAILSALQLMERLPGNIGKKMDMVRNSVEKLERMLYEMSLSEAAGGRPVHSQVDNGVGGGGDGGGDNDVPMKTEKE